MGKKLYQTADGLPGKRYLFHCPACNIGHCFVTKADTGPLWSFNGDLERPTFDPSLMYYRDSYGMPRCHLYVREGKIIFLPDCEHELKGQTVEMEDVR